MAKKIRKKLVIFGSGVHSKVIFHSVVNNKNYNFIGFVDYLNKNKIILKHKKKDYKIIDNLNRLNSLKKYKNLYGVIGVGSNFNRLSILKTISKHNIKINWETIIFKNSNISENVKIGKGSVIMANTLLNNNTVIGNHCIINSGSIIEHDNIFGDFSSTGPGVTTGGNVKVENLSHIGIGATIVNNIKVESNTIVGANSLVNKNCKSYSIYFGNPAKKKKKRKFNTKYL